MPQQRRTQQRQVISDILANTRKPLYPKEILDIAKITLPQIGIATVFRALKSLVKEETAQVVRIGDDPARYEAINSHHHHFKCYGCGEVFNLFSCPGNMEKLLPPGFELHSHDITLFGNCSNCAEALHSV